MFDSAQGDRILTPAGVESITGFFHDANRKVRKFMSFTHEFGELTVSAGHLLFLADGSSVIAGDVKVGTVLATANSASKVQSIDFVTVNDFKIIMRCSRNNILLISAMITKLKYHIWFVFCLRLPLLSLEWSPSAVSTRLSTLT